MKHLWIFAILFGFLLTTSPALGYTSSKFVSEYGGDLSEGQKIKVLVKVKGIPESEDPTKRAKEIRYLQSAVLKFCNFAGAINVKSHTWDNEFTAMVTVSLAQVLEQRNDVISVHVIEAPILLPPKLQELFEHDIEKLPFWIQTTINWHNEGKISEVELINAIKYLLIKSSNPEKTILKLHDMGTVSHNGGQPIVFSGRLDTTSGEAVSDAEILIKSDGGCPDDGIIANGTTDKNGRYWILTLTKIWDPSDNLIKIHAEFLGDEQFYPSKSQIEVVVVYPSHAEKCVS